MKIAILSRDRRLYSTSRLVEAAEIRGHEVEVIDYLRCYMNIASHNPKVMYQGHVLEGFDRLIVSQECGPEKPDPAIFAHVAALSGHAPAAHLFIDDIPAYVEGARRAGFDAILHTDAAALRTALTDRGLVGD